jgi:hypothetical protein
LKTGSRFTLPVLIPLATAHLGFYEAAAQVIPVLLLVMAFGETRLRVDMPKRANYSDAYFVLAGFLVVITGEVAALRVLATGQDDGGLHSLTASGLALGLSFILYRFAFLTMRDLRKKPGEESTDSTVGQVLFVVFLSVGMFWATFWLLGP